MFADVVCFGAVIGAKRPAFVALVDGTGEITAKTQMTQRGSWP